MSTVELAIRVVLAIVFVTAGVGKLLDQTGSRQSMREFGVSERLAGPAALLLPLAELAVATALILRPSAQLGAVAALALLLVFAAGIGNAMRQGLQPDCNCFGQIHSAPAGRSTLVRNGIFSALAIFLLAAGSGPALDDWLSARSAAELVAVVAVPVAAALAVWVLQLRAQVKQLNDAVTLERRRSALMPPGLPVGADAPNFELFDVESGAMVSLREMRKAGHPVMLMFTSPRCGPCSEIFPSLRRWQQALSEQLTIALVSTGTAEENRYTVEEHGLQRVLLQETIEVTDAYGIRSTPSALMVTAGGKVATTTAVSVFEIEPMIRHALRGGDLATALTA